MAAAVKEAKAPTKGVKPDMRGVPGVMIDELPDGVMFGVKNKVSPYDVLLRQLVAAPAGKFLRFDDLRARASVYTRAKKLGIKVLFGEQGNTLYVMIAKADLADEGVTEKQPPPITNKDRVLAAIGDKRCTPGEILTWMRSNGAGGVGITQVDDLLNILVRERKIRNVSGTRDETPRYALL